MRSSALKQMHLMTEDLKSVLKPTSSGMVAADIPDVSIRLGMKNRKTPYPKDFVEMDSNLTSGRFIIQMNHAHVREDTAFIDKNLFVALTFFQPDQVIMTTE
jgi:hypothetical protein